MLLKNHIYYLVPDATRISHSTSFDATLNSKDRDENSVSNSMSSSKDEEILHSEGQFSSCSVADEEVY